MPRGICFERKVFFMGKRLKKKETNFYRIYMKKPAKSRTVRIIYRLLILPVLLVVAFVGAFAVFFILNVSKQQKIDDLQVYTQQQDQVTLMQEAGVIAKEKTAYTATHTKLATLRRALDSYPKFDLETFLTIASCIEETNVAISGMQYDSDLGILSLDGRSPFVVDAPIFVQHLRDTELFFAINYTGYGSDSDGIYRFHVECLKRGVDSQ